MKKFFAILLLCPIFAGGADYFADKLSLSNAVYSTSQEAAEVNFNLETNSLGSTWFTTNGGILYASGFTNGAINTIWYPIDVDNLLWSNRAGYYSDSSSGMDIHSPDTTTILTQPDFDYLGGWTYSGSGAQASGVFRYATNYFTNSYAPSSAQIPYQYFKTLCRNMALSNQVSGTYAGMTMNRYNAGNKTGYTDEYLRDFVLAMQATNVCTHTQIWIRAYLYKQNINTNAFPDLLKNTNTFTAGTIGRSVDSAYYYNALLYLGWKQAAQEGITNPTRIFTNNFAAVTNAILAGITHSNALVWQSGERIGWGFHDNLYFSKTGMVTMESVLEYAAWGKIAEMAYNVGTAEYTNVGDWAAAKLPGIASSLETNLFDWNTGLYRMCSTRTNFDVIGSAFAVHCGAAQGLVKQRIAQAFVDGYYGGRTFRQGKGLWQGGRLRMLPRGEVWPDDPYLSRVDGGKHYQFGGYWAFGGWGMTALAVYRPDLAERALSDLYAETLRQNECWEWLNAEYLTAFASTMNSQIYLMMPGSALHYGKKEFDLR